MVKTEGSLARPSNNRRPLTLFKRATYKARELGSDWLYGVDTQPDRSSLAGDWKGEKVFYQALPYAGLAAIDRRLPLSPDDIVYDLGCGKGRVVFHFARKAIRAVIGVEHDSQLAEIARLNLSKIRTKASDIRILCADAESCDYSTCTVLFMYNPFGPETMRKVMSGIFPRSGMKIVYANPIHEDVFSEFPGVVEVDRFTIPYREHRMPVAIWHT